MNDPIRMMLFFRAVMVALLGEMIISRIFLIAATIGMYGSPLHKAIFIYAMLAVIAVCIGYLIGKARNG